MFNFDSPDKVLREQMAYEYYGYPSDYLERFRAVGASCGRFSGDWICVGVHSDERFRTLVATGK